MRCGSPCLSFQCRAVSSSVCCTPFLAASQSVTDLTDHTLFERSWTSWSPPRRSTPTPPGPGRVLRFRRAAHGDRDVGDARAHAARTAPLAYSAIDLPEAGLEPRVLRSCVVGSGILLRIPTTWSTFVCCARPVRAGWRSTAWRPRSTTGPAPGDLARGGGARAGARGVETSRTYDIDHHQCGAGHPA